MGYSLVQGENDLRTWCEQNGERGQRILEEWDVEANWRKGFILAPCDMHALSAKKVMWRCKDCGNVFEQAINARTKAGQGCPICGKKNGGRKNSENALVKNGSLLDWCMRNGEYGEQLMKEWDEVRNREELGLAMDKVTAGKGDKVYWICSKCGGSFQCSISHRTICGTGCTLCGNYSTSYPEQFLYYGIKQICKSAANRGKYFDDLEYDIYVPEWNLYIEYGSCYYHEGREEKDKRKREICLQNGGRFISIMDEQKSAEEYFSDSEIIVNINDKNQNVTLEKILKYILEMFGHSINEVDIDKVYSDVIRRMGKNVEDDKDVATLFPNLAAEWFPEINNGARPENYSAGSHKKIKWTCTNCGNVWENSINSRIRFRSGCPKCGYCVFDGRKHAPNKTRTKYKVYTMNSYI